MGLEVFKKVKHIPAAQRTAELHPIKVFQIMGVLKNGNFMDFLDNRLSPHSSTLKDCHFEVLRVTEMCFTFLRPSDPI